MLDPLLTIILLAAPGAEAPPAMTLPTGVLSPDPILLVQDDEEEEKPDKRPEVKELLDRLKGHAGKRGKEDQQAIEAIDELTQEFEKSGLKDRAAIAKGVGDTLKQKRQEVDGVRDNKLYLASATALGLMGPESVKPLSSWIGHKTHRKDLPLQRVLILSLGKTKNEKSVGDLIDLLDNKDAMVQAAAAEAMANFDGSDQKVRKDCFKEILQVLMGVNNRVKADVNDTIARERYDVVAAPMITTLQILSGNDERQPDGWQRWWNKNKKRNWDKED
jgi:HEAT repeat protein